MIKKGWVGILGSIMKKERMRFWSSILFIFLVVTSIVRIGITKWQMIREKSQDAWEELMLHLRNCIMKPDIDGIGFFL